MPAARTRLACSLFAVPVALVSLTASAAPWNPVDQAVFNDAGQYWSRDVELVDLDNDGFVDILFANVGGVFEGTDDAEMPNQAFHNDAGAAFSDISMDVFGGDPDTAHSIKTCDIDNDGDQDIILGATWEAQSQLLRNDGGAFTNVTDTNLPQLVASVGDVACGDVDEDGDIDLALTDWGPPEVGQINSLGGTTMLWLNDGTGVFTDVTASQMPDIAVNYALDLDFVDVDNDYDLDLVIACRACATGSLLYENDGDGMFTAATPAAFSALGNREFEAMDINADGALDLLTLGDGQGGMEGVRNRLLINDGLGDFTDDTNTYWPLLENPGSGDRAAVFLDIDADADVDIALVTNASVIWPDRLMVNDGGVFTQNVAPFDMVNTEGTLAVETVDFNGDFHPDIVLASGENAFRNRVLFANVDETSTDTVPPALMHVEQVDEAPYPGDVVIHARVHDYKTPNKPHDWEAVYLEWAEGIQDAAYLEMNGTTVNAYWYGENMWMMSFPTPDVWAITYRVCAIDIAQNVACSDVYSPTCPDCDQCGNMMCDDGENNNNCPEDCDPMCGNDVVEDGEECDDNGDPNCVDCVDQGGNTTAGPTVTDSETETDSDSNPNTITDSDSESDSDGGGMCLDDSDCPAGQICVNGMCVDGGATDSDSATEGLDDDGCDCSAQSSGQNALGALALMMLAGLGRRRRRS